MTEFKRSGTRIFASAYLFAGIWLLPDLPATPLVFAFTNSEVAFLQNQTADKPLGERIVFWAEKFVGVPYDPDPVGEYVTRKTIVADDRVDCMYLSFRSVELAMGHTPDESVRIALDKRFIGKGALEGGSVVNYEERFQYGEDMLDSGKWGREITRAVGPVSLIRGSRGREQVMIVSKEALIKMSERTTRPSLKSGDFIFFAKVPDKRMNNEIIGHIGVIKMEGGTPYLIHASGRKNGGGKVRKVLFYEYVKSMPFAGVRVSRLP